MGLDLIELTLAIEDAFGIYIPNEEAERLETPGQVVDYFAARLVPGVSPGCLSQRAFYRLRAAGVQVLERPREEFTPETSWCDLLHPESAWRFQRRLVAPQW